MRFLARILALVMLAGGPAFAAGDLAVVQSTATILSGASLSGAIDLGPNRAFAIVMPASWTTANLTFQGSADGITYNNLYDDTGTEVSVTAAASQYIVVSSPAKLLGVRWIKRQARRSTTRLAQARPSLRAALSAMPAIPRGSTRRQTQPPAPRLTASTPTAAAHPMARRRALAALVRSVPWPLLAARAGLL